MTMTKGPNKKEKSLKNVWWFVGFAILCSLVTLWTMNFANRRLETTHSIIISHQAKSIEGLDSLISIYRNFQIDSTYKTSKYFDLLNNQLLEIAKTAEETNRTERISNLLESELAKIQNEYEVLNLWCALLTVVFLIFSFFSIFKANEMANQSEDALNTMREIERDVQSKSESIDKKIKEANGKIDNLDKSISNIETEHKKLSESINTFKDSEIRDVQNKIDGLKSSAKEIEDLNNFAKADLKKLTDDLKKELEEKEKSSIGNLEPTIKDMAKSNYDQNAYDLNSRINKLENSLDKLSKDFQELAKEDEDKAAIAAEEADECDKDTDEEESLNETDDKK